MMTQKERSRRWYLKHKELAKARAKAYAKAHPEKRREYARQWRANAPDDVLVRERARCRAWHHANRDKHNAMCASWGQNHREERTAQRREYNKRTGWARRRAQEQRDTLSDQYVRYVLSAHSTLRGVDMPSELVELKRAELKLRRYLRDHES